MQFVDLGLEGGFFIERCDQCMGLFFDPGSQSARRSTSLSRGWRRE
ncbi:MAG: hypothetical protein GY854_32815 [Deltaproteobacteria bacterium]|nr:hypothetical protein [Deltaproteobacteria bacterium]